MSTATKEPSTCKLTLQVGDTSYAIRPVPPDRLDDVTHKAYRLRKEDGTTYTVSRSLNHEIRCTCEASKFRRQELCKHARILVALSFFPSLAENERLARILKQAVADGKATLQ